MTPEAGASAIDSRPIGRRRRLLRLADGDGLIMGLAIDHRDSFVVALAKHGLDGMDAAVAARVKQALIKTIGHAASAVMIDADIGLLSLLSGDVPSHVGMVMPLEAQGYEQQGDQRRTELLADFSPAVALSFGADACKLLVPLRPDLAAVAEAQVTVVREAIASCHSVAVPIVVEPVVYRLEDEPREAFAERYTWLAARAAEAMADLEPDLLKLPFPEVDRPDDRDEARAADACRQIAEVVRAVPWVLLGAGVKKDTFLWQLRLAGRAGACGFLVGRSIWGDALSATPERTETLGREVGLPRFQECMAVARSHCRPLSP